MLTVGADLRGLTADNRAQVRELVAAMTAPADYAQAELLAVRLDAGTKRRGEDEAATAFAADLYVRELMAWPLDVARAAVEQLLDGTWFPAVGELRAACRQLAGPRKAILDAVDGWREPTPEEARATELRAQARDLRIKAAEIGRKAGPGPINDDGPRGALLAERLAAETEAQRLEAEARALLT